MTNNAKKGLDLPRWRPLMPQIGTNLIPATGPASSALTSDIRGRGYADPNIFALPTTVANMLQSYNVVTDGWSMIGLASSIGGTLGSGTGFKFVPSQGPSGTITSGASTTSVTLSTALPGSVEKNQLAARGDKTGYIIRIIDNVSGGSGKIEERRIVANTAGTTPTIHLNEALSFTPGTDARYEILSGAIYILSTGASKAWVRFDVATGVLTSLTTTGLIATVGTVYNELVSLDEQHVPYNRYPGEGFVVDNSTVYDNTTGWAKKCLTATATAAGTITGQATGGDASLPSNKFRNFQIRIVEDTTTPTAVGQRRRITSHTAGASPVYTLASNWTVTPSATCKFVIENDNDKIIFLTNSTTVYNYNIGANTWDTTTWATRGTAPSTGLGAFQAFGIVDDKNVASVSEIFSLRCAGAGGNPVDVLDIAGGSTGTWSSFAMTPNFTTSILPPSSGFGCAYDPITNDGVYMYFVGYFSTNTGPMTIYRLNLKTRNITTYSPIPTLAPSVSDSVTNKLVTVPLYEADGSLTLLFCRIPQNGAGAFYSCPLVV